jgi:hypothetical protein
MKNSMAQQYCTGKNTIEQSMIIDYTMKESVTY